MPQPRQQAPELGRLNPGSTWRARLLSLAGRHGVRFFKFVIVGGLAFVVDAVALTTLVLVFALNHTFAKGIAFLLAVLTSFAGNYFWTYSDSRSKPVVKQIAQFIGVSLVGLVINLLVFRAVQAAAIGPWGELPAMYMGEVVAVGAALVWNFLANRFVTYDDVL